MFDKLFDFGDDDAQRENYEYNPDGLTKLQRQRPNGRLSEPDPPKTEFGVDRDGSGQFASRDRDEVALLRQRDGTLEPDRFAVGNFFDEFEDEDKRR